MTALPVQFEVFTDPAGGVMRIRGDLDLCTAPVLNRHLHAAIAWGAGDLLVDLSECGFIDSAGLNVLVRSAERMSKTDAGQLRLVRPNRQTRRLFDLLGITYSSNSVDPALTVVG